MIKIIRILILIQFFQSISQANEICDIKNISNPESIAKPYSRIARIVSTDNNKLWTFKLLSSNKTLKLSPETRLITLSENINGYTRVAGWINNELQEGFVNSNAISNDETHTKISTSTFLNESYFIISLIKKMNVPTNSSFYKLAFETEVKLNTLVNKYKKISTPAKFNTDLNSVNLKLSAMLNINQNDRVETMARLSNVLFSIYNPIISNSNSKHSVSDETLVVPLSRKWFESYPELKDYYSNNFLKVQDFDTKLSFGKSGEGLVNYSSSNEFSSYILQFEKLNKFIKTNGSEELKKSPEAQWVNQQIANNFSKKRRMIFIHPETWDNSNSKWADYIAIDQSIGGVISSKMLSVLMHELNVNGDNYNFFPSDSHSPSYDSYSLWNCVEKNGINSLKNNPINLSKFLGIQAPMSLVYLNLILKIFEKIDS